MHCIAHATRPFAVLELRRSARAPLPAPPPPSTKHLFFSAAPFYRKYSYAVHLYSQRSRLLEAQYRRAQAPLQHRHARHHAAATSPRLLIACSLQARGHERRCAVASRHLFRPFFN